MFLLFADSINHYIEHKGLIVYAWVIMSSHVHMIIGTRKDLMQDTVRDFKKYTSKAIINSITDNSQESRKEWLLWMFERSRRKNGNNSKYQFWQQHNHAIELYNNKLIDQELNYLHNNPVEDGYVYEIFEYKYSSAIDYCGGKGLIPIELLA